MKPWKRCRNSSMPWTRSSAEAGSGDFPEMPRLGGGVFLRHHHENPTAASRPRPSGLFRRAQHPRCRGESRWLRAALRRQVPRRLAHLQAGEGETAVAGRGWCDHAHCWRWRRSDHQGCLSGLRFPLGMEDRRRWELRRHVARGRNRWPPLQDGTGISVARFLRQTQPQVSPRTPARKRRRRPLRACSGKTRVVEACR